MDEIVKKKSSGQNSKKKSKSEKTVAKETRKRTRALAQKAREKKEDSSVSVGTFLKSLNGGKEMPVMTSKQIKQYLTAIMVGLVKDGLTNMPAGIDDKIKAANYLNAMLKEDEEKKKNATQEEQEQNANREIIEAARQFNQEHSAEFKVVEEGGGNKDGE